jgi:cobalamin biosynthesis Co2+ chelatase CbiK
MYLTLEERMDNLKELKIYMTEKEINEARDAYDILTDILPEAVIYHLAEEDCEAIKTSIKLLDRVRHASIEAGVYNV